MTPALCPGSRGSADSYALPRYHQELVQLLRVVAEHVGEPLDRVRDVGEVAQSQQDDTGVRLTPTEDEFSEIPIVGDEDTLLRSGDAKDIGIGEARGIVRRQPGDVVPLLSQVRREARIGALILQELHPCAGAAEAASRPARLYSLSTKSCA